MLIAKWVCITGRVWFSVRYDHNTALDRAMREGWTDGITWIKFPFGCFVWLGHGNQLAGLHKTGTYAKRHLAQCKLQFNDFRTCSNCFRMLRALHGVR